MKYWQTYQNAVTTNLIYRGNLLLRMLTIAINILVTSFMWLAVFRFSSRDTIAGINANQMIIYLIFVNVLSLIFFPAPIFTLSNLIRTGNLSVILLRPINYFTQSFWTYVGQATPYLIIYGLAIGLGSPVMRMGWAYGIGSLLLIGLTFLMYFLLISLISLTSFWLIQVWPLRPVINALFLLLGGQAFPLQILPKTWQWLTLNPFSLAGNQLTLLLLGKLSQPQLWRDSGMALLWLIITTILLKKIWRRGIQSYEGVGS